MLLHVLPLRSNTCEKLLYAADFGPLREGMLVNHTPWRYETDYDLAIADICKYADWFHANIAVGNKPRITRKQWTEMVRHKKRLVRVNGSLQEGA
jgi:hypothetical protein